VGQIRKLQQLKALVTKARARGKTVVLTNGCFDLLHRGHLHLIRESKKLGDLLIVAVNSDSSVKKIKGPNRPILPETERAELLAALELVDYVTVFSEPDPYHIIDELRPDVLVKGSDWAQDRVIGREIVEGDGGKVAIIPLLPSHSTTSIIERISRN
jgi:D-beta-D-heptose 7-phosphate kinase/D-beta-D-heptose 1-phosphate adenosyltransferase